MGRISQLIENAQTFMVKNLPIKWNLMPEFSPLLGRLKSVKYVAASPVNRAHACKGRSARSGGAVHLDIFIIRINGLLALTPQ